MGSKSSNLIHILTTSMDKISQVNSDFEINDIMEGLLNKFTNSDLTHLYIYDNKKQLLYSKKENAQPLSMADPMGLLGNAFLTKKPAMYNYPISEKYFKAEIDNSDKIQLKCQMIFPIIEEDELLGIVRTNRKIYHSKQYTKKDLELLNSLHTFIVKIIHILTNQKNSDKINTDEINEKIKATEKMNNSVSTKSDLAFFSNAIHDIRTPANALHGFLELLEDQIDDKRLKEFVKNAKESAVFINTLTDSILEQTKESFTQNQLNPVVVSSVKYFSQITNMFSANMSDKEISYLTYIDPHIPKEIQIDEQKLKRILINLIGNAYKFTARGGRIEVKILYDKPTESLEISVVDNGIGIDDEQQIKIFNAFSQADENISENYGGTGLGLSISSQYVELLGGKLELESKINFGSKFYFTIPVSVENASQSYDNFVNLNKKVMILSHNLENPNIDMIYTYLVTLGMPKDKIVIGDRFESDTTHLFCFEDSVTDSLFEYVSHHKIKLLLIEKKLFSLSNKKEFSRLEIVPENSYYGNFVHSTVFSEKKKRVLIADDNKINITLLTYMLETDYVEIDSVLDGESALKLLQESQQKENRYDIVFLDNNMPIVSGIEVLEKIRMFEDKHQLEPLFAISITGDPKFVDADKNLFNTIVKKPFNKQKVQEALYQANNYQG